MSDAAEFVRVSGSESGTPVFLRNGYKVTKKYRENRWGNDLSDAGISIRGFGVVFGFEKRALRGRVRASEVGKVRESGFMRRMDRFSGKNAYFCPYVIYPARGMRR